MGAFFSKTKPQFKAAGCVFVSKTHILAGYQPNKMNPYISGFGGKRKDDETFIETALRETLEELLNIKEVPIALIHKIEKTIIPEKIIFNKTYRILVYTFDNLAEILACVKYYIGQSVLYPRALPINVSELLMERVILGDAEVSHLSILPLVSNLQIDKCFLEDIRKLL